MQLDELKDKISRAFKDERFGRVERIKGFAKADGVNYLVNSTKYEETVEPVGTGQSIIIVIGSKMNKEEIESLFAK